MADKINWKQDQPAPRRAIRIIHANFPQAHSLGIYVCRDVKGTGVQSSHAEGRALDIGLRASDPSEKFIGDQLFQGLIDSAYQSGIDNVIWNRQIWSRQNPQPRPFTGNYMKNGRPRIGADGKPVPKNPHIDHIHVEWTKDGSQLQHLNFLELNVSEIRGGIEEITAQQSNIA